MFISIGSVIIALIVGYALGRSHGHLQGREEGFHSGKEWADRNNLESFWKKNI